MIRAVKKVKFLQHFLTLLVHVIYLYQEGEGDEDGEDDGDEGEEEG